MESLTATVMLPYPASRRQHARRGGRGTQRAVASSSYAERPAGRPEWPALLGARMRMRTVAILALIALFSTSACAAARSSSDAAPPASEGAAARPAAAPAAGAPAPRQAAATTAGAPANDAQQSVPSLDRMIIRTVNMT